MSVRRQQHRDPVTGAEREFWMVDVLYRKPDGSQAPRIRKVSPVQTRRGAEEYERQLRQALLDGSHEREEVPTFKDWFEGRFWREWVVSRKNKPSEVGSKKSIFSVHLEPALGKVRVDQIDAARIAQFRTALIEKDLGDKRINNILAVLSKALRYAEEVQLIQRAPRVGLFRVERPEIVAWEFEQYARILASAQVEGPMWYAAACLAGEAGLRIGEVRALRYREDLDLIAETITINQQSWKGVIGTPKGRTRRTVPMTPTLVEAIKALDQIRTGMVVRNADGTPITDGQTTHCINRICRRAGLPQCGWHKLRHSFGTHAATFGVNPWRLQGWMGHKAISETMLYVHVAEDHHRKVPQPILDAGAAYADPDWRIIAMLGARGRLERPHVHLAAPEKHEALR